MKLINIETRGVGKCFCPDLSECVSAEASAAPRVTARPPPARQHCGHGPVVIRVRVIAAPHALGGEVGPRGALG